MSRLNWLRAVAPCAFLVAASACSSNNPVGSTPTQNSTTVEFTGTLNNFGSITHPFAGLAAGQVSVQLISLDPGTVTDAAGNVTNIAVGLELGVWDGNACDRKVHNDKVLISTSVVANETAAGSLCASVYDATGQLPGPINYDIQVTHP
jgi:hypothetical protein